MTMTVKQRGLDSSVLEALRPSLLRFFERRLPSAAGAEDLTQEVFLHLARSGSEEVLREPQRYVFRVATNVLRDRIRMGTARRADRHMPLDDPDMAGEMPSAERVHEARELLDQVLAVLAELPPKCRTSFVLHRFEGLSYTEIARRLGVSRSAIEKQMMHAIQVLSDRFKD